MGPVDKQQVFCESDTHIHTHARRHTRVHGHTHGAFLPVFFLLFGIEVLICVQMI